MKDGSRVLLKSRNNEKSKSEKAKQQMQQVECVRTALIERNSIAYILVRFEVKQSCLSNKNKTTKIALSKKHVRCKSNTKKREVAVCAPKVQRCFKDVVLGAKVKHQGWNKHQASQQCVEALLFFFVAPRVRHLRWPSWLRLINTYVRVWDCAQ